MMVAVVIHTKTKAKQGTPDSNHIIIIILCVASLSDGYEVIVDLFLFSFVPLAIFIVESTFILNSRPSDSDGFESNGTKDLLLALFNGYPRSENFGRYCLASKRAFPYHVVEFNWGTTSGTRWMGRR